MRIIHVTHSFYPCIGGVERNIEDICRGMIGMGHESDVVSLDRCSNSEVILPPFEEYDKIKIYRIPFIDLKFYKVAPRVLNIVKRYDIVHIHGIGFFSDFLSMKKFLHGKPLVLSTHGGIFHTKSISLIKKIYFNVFCRLTMKKIDRLVSISKKDKRMFSKISDSLIIPNGIDFRGLSGTKRRDENSFLYLGRISKNKRIDDLIRTFSHLKKSMPDLKLNIAGRDWEGIEIDLKFMVDRLGLKENVNFLGEVDEKTKTELLAGNRFFVSASEYEGFGISVLESMATGSVPIVNDIEAFSEYIKNGKNGFIIDFSDHEEAARRILEISKMKDLDGIAKSSRETARKFDKEKIIGKFVKLYKVVGGHEKKP